MNTKQLRTLAQGALLATVVAAAPLAAAAPANAAPAHTAVTAAPIVNAVAPTMSVSASSPYSNIKAMQHLLSAWGFATTADGSFGPGTRDQVAAFQRSRGIAVNSYVADSATMKALTNTSGFRGSPNANTSSAVQQLLVKIGYALTVDGSFGPTTENAVIHFQGRIQVEQTGVVDATTWAFLFVPPGSTSTGMPDFKVPLPCGNVGQFKTYVGHNPVDKKIDMYNNTDTTDSPVLTSAPGKVIQVVPSNGEVEISHGNGWFTLYLHMKNIRVAEGTQVGRSQTIGTMSDVNGNNVVHLHYEQRYAPTKTNSTNEDIVHPTIQGEKFIMQPGVYPSRVSQNCG